MAPARAAAAVLLLALVVSGTAAAPSPRGQRPQRASSASSSGDDGGSGMSSGSGSGGRAPRVPSGGATLIVEYASGAVSAASVASSSGSGGSGTVSVAAKAASAAAVAVAAATERGAGEERRAAIAATATQAVIAAQAVASLTSSVAISAREAGVGITGVTHYGAVLHGAAIRTASDADAARLKAQLEANPAVQRVWLAQTRSLPRPVETNADAGSDGAAAPQRDRRRSPTDPPAGASGGFSNARAAAAAAPTAATTGNAAATGLAAALAAQPGLSGAGALVCVVDTGINYKSSPIYGGCTGLNAPRGACRVVTGFNFVGDDYVGTTTGPPPVAGGEPTDCYGHGSMVASVAATSNGVAPGALLGSYRVFGCDGYSADDVIIAAIDRAVTDGCDIINLSLASGSGYSRGSVYDSVMANAQRQGVLVVKAAGNSGDDGPFNADVFTAAGSIAVAAVGNDAAATPLDKDLVVSGFSSFGPNPTLELSPHVAAPGAFISVINMDGNVARTSGTSFASPYVSGVLALWLQTQQSAAAAANTTVPAAAISQAAAMEALVATAAGVPDRGSGSSSGAWLEPVARVGGGVVQVDALLRNRLRVSPSLMQVPSALNGSVSRVVTLRWDGPPAATADGLVTYDVVHAPAASMTLADGWYGTDAAITKAYIAATVTATPSTVTINTTAKAARPARVRVTVSLPEELRARGLLYSGQLRLVPRLPSAAKQQQQQQGLQLPPPVAVLYQGFSQPMASLPLLAQPLARLSASRATRLQNYANGLCYAPRSVPAFLNAVMDSLADVPAVCTGGFVSEASDEPLRVSLAALAQSPDCSLRLTAAPQVPVRALFVDLLDAASGAKLGALAPLDTASGSSLATPGRVASFCLNFNGTYAAAGGGEPAMLSGGRAYALRATWEGPLAAADVARGAKPNRQAADIGGRFVVVA